MQFELVGRPARLPIEISRRIEEAIRLGRYKPGERLPTEAALAASFGVSRNAVREAIARLKSHGLVRTRQGLGAFVEELREETGFRVAPDSLTEPAALRHLYEVRLELEAGAAARAAARHAQEELDRIARRDRLEDRRVRVEHVPDRAAVFAGAPAHQGDAAA